MAFPNNTNIPTAVDKMTEMDLSGVHITTSNFMQLDVAKCMELVPKQSVDINHLVFARLEPLVAPTFGLAQIHKKAFFVPYRTIFRAWDDFINDSLHVYADGQSGMVSSVPTIYDRLFTDTLTSIEYSESTSETRADFVVTSVTYTGVNEGRTVAFLPYRFTNKGKRIFKMLTALGYKLTWTSDLQILPTRVSLLPLFALAKVYLDWYYPNQYVQDATSVNVEKWLKSDNSFDYVANFTKDDLSDFFEIIDRVCYNNDYLTSAWDNPTTPNQGAKSNFTLLDFTTVGNNQYDEKNRITNSTSPYNQAGTPVVQATGYTDINPISQYALTALKSLSDYLKRHQIAGSRAIDRFLARWGVQLPADKMNRSLYLGGSYQDVDFGDVTSTASTDGAALGDYAGKGVSLGDDNISFETKEFGMLLILTSIVPRTSYYQGALRHTLHTSKLDFYTPEFDNLGVQPILRSEVYLPMDTRKNYDESSPSQTVDFAEDIFGFAPRYAEYKKGDDILSGDYILDSKNVGKDAWNLFRNLDHLFANKGSRAVKHSINFVNASDSEQYNRIFTVTDTSFDKFNIIHKFDIKTRFPGHSLYDDYEFSSQDKAPDVTLNTGSVKAN